jgi:choline transport protein
MGVFFFFNLLVGLIPLGSDLAFYAILSGGGVALQVSYAIPIICVVVRGRDKIMPSRSAFNLGNKRGYALNWISILWSVVVVLFYVFPQFMPVAGAIANMNWAIAILGGVIVLAAVAWFVTARKSYLRGDEASPIFDGITVVLGKHATSGTDHLDNIPTVETDKEVLSA